jgi:DNA-binding CsgD family transcriptional regulator
MKGMLEDFFVGSGSSLCVLKPGRRVDFQNRACRALCGNYTGEDCPQYCASSCGLDTEATSPGGGTRFFPNTRVGKEQFDALFIDRGPRRLVILSPLAGKHERLLARFLSKGLSRREMDVVRLGLKGLPNKRVREELGVSAATLKTHLNNIYRKYPEARNGNWRGKG